MTLKRPTDILTDHPELKTVWCARELGYLLMLGLVRGQPLRRTCLLDEKDVMKIYKIRLQFPLNR